MSLLAPLFLLGAFAIGLPLWLHRLQTQSSERKPFSSAMLLETTDQRVHVQKRLKYLLLLAFRVAVLLLIAFAFAKPFIERPQGATVDTGAGSDLIVIDASLSMGRSGVFAQALAEARRAIDLAPEGATRQVIAAGASVRELQPPTADRGSVRAALAGLEPGTARVDAGVLMSAIETRAAVLPPPVRLHFVSDFQASAMPAQFADVVPAGVRSFTPWVVGTGDPVNWSVIALRRTADGVEATVQNEGLPDRMADVELRLNGSLIDTRSVTGQGRYTIAFDDLALEAGDNRVEVTLVTDDDLDADNRAYLVLRNDPPSPVPLITRNPGGLPVTYLTAALEAVADARFRVETRIPGDFDPRTLTRFDWLIVDDLGSVDAGLAGTLTEFLDRGGNLLAFAGDATRALDVLPVSDRALAAADLGSGNSAFREIAGIDDRHPALAKTRGWHRVRVSQSVALEDESDLDVLARLDNGAPFIVEERRGSGRLLLVLSGIDNRWNDLPVHAVFVSFMIEAADYLSGRPAEFGTHYVGDTLSLAAAGSGQVVGPDGESLVSLADTATGVGVRLENAGFFTVYTAGDESLVAVNVDPRESELAAIRQDVLDRWRDATFPARDAADSAAGTVADPLELWPWLLLLLAVFVIAESALGNVHIASRLKGTT
ncbi:MAG: BatA domain-containing protein [Woeseiaceae bacterium]|nr:BatA domain-containing protein [Woeseiaceae bacterium]